MSYDSHPKSSSSTMVVVLVVVLVLLVVMCICGIIGGAALLLPAVQQAREAARRVESGQDLKQIGVALQAYHDTYKTFPPAFIPDDNGQPRVSWRTALLPFLAQEALDSQYNRSASWNDPANAPVVNVPLDVFLSPRDPSPLPNRTNYVVVRGPDTLFPGAEPRTMADMVRGLGNTILVVEIRNSDIAWAEPRDLDIDSLTTDPSAPNSIHLDAGVTVLAGDGSVHTVRLTLEELTALLLRQGSATMQ